MENNLPDPSISTKTPLNIRIKPNIHLLWLLASPRRSPSMTSMKTPSSWMTPSQPTTQGKLSAPRPRSARSLGCRPATSSRTRAPSTCLESDLSGRKLRLTRCRPVAEVVLKTILLRQPLLDLVATSPSHPPTPLTKRTCPDGPFLKRVDQRPP